MTYLGLDPAAHFNPPPRPRTNGHAVAALVLGIVGLCGFIGILGLVFGIIAKKKIAAHSHYTGDGLASAGIILGCVSIVGTLVQLARIGGALGWW